MSLNPKHRKKPLDKTISASTIKSTEIIPEKDKSIIDYKDIDKTLNIFKEQDTDIIDAFNKLDNIISLMPESQYIDTVDKIAYTLSNITINDEKVFNDIEDVKKVLQKMRNKNNGKIRKYKLPKKFYKLVKDKEQLTLSPMITKNIKPSTITHYIYQF